MNDLEAIEQLEDLKVIENSSKMDEALIPPEDLQMEAEELIEDPSHPAPPVAIISREGTQIMAPAKIQKMCRKVESLVL